MLSRCFFQDTIKNSSKLLDFLKNGKVNEFEEIIKRDRKIDVNHFYGEPDFGTLLDIACRLKGKSEFVHILIQNGADVNLLNYVTHTYAIHEAVEKSDQETVTCLIESKNHKAMNIITRENYEAIPMIEVKCHPAINLQNKEGNRPLNICINTNNIEFLKILIQSDNPPIYINKENALGLSPLHIALSRNQLEVARLLLEFPDIDLDLRKDGQGNTCGQIIQQKYPHLLDQLPKEVSCNSKRILWSLLYQNNTKEFIRVAQQFDAEYLDDYFNGFTYLQFACSEGYKDVVDMLLVKGLNPNKFCADNVQDLSPLNIAASQCHYNIFKRLLEDDRVRSSKHNDVGTVLYWVIQKMIAYKKDKNPVKCYFFAFMVNDIIPKRIMNFGDFDGDILNPFHAASHLNYDQVTKALIYVAVNYGKGSNFGKIPWETIQATALEDYLDDCISSPDSDPIHNFISSTRDYVQKKKDAIKFNYKLFVNPTRGENEMDVISAIEKVPHLKKLLKHPIIKSFLYMKWCLIKKYYYLNLITYFLFYVTLNLYIISIHNQEPFLPNIPNNSTTNNASTYYNMPFTSTFACDSKIFLLIFYWMIILREFCQFCFSPKSYIKITENWLEIIMIFMTGAFFLTETDADLRYSFATYAIITASMELVFILGKHPSCATYIEMFKTVAWNFFKFFLLYSTLIISFGISFFISFNRREVPKNEPNSNDADEKSLNFWRNPVIAIFRTIIMLTGELGSDSLPFSLMLSNTHIIYAVFVFLITIVLYNLLNGLAVSDTRAISEDAEFFALVSRVKSISQLERLSTKNPFKYLRCIGDHLWLVFSQVYGKKIKLFGDKLHTTEIEVRNKKIHLLKRVEDKDDANCAEELFPWKMPSSIVGEAFQILENRTDLHLFMDPDNRFKIGKINEYRQNFQSIDKLGHTLVAHLRKFADNDKELMEHIKTLHELMVKQIPKQNE